MLFLCVLKYSKSFKFACYSVLVVKYSSLCVDLLWKQMRFRM